MEGRQADDRVLPASHFPIFCHSNICCSSNQAFPLSLSPSLSIESPLPLSNPRLRRRKTDLDHIHQGKLSQIQAAAATVADGDGERMREGEGLRRSHRIPRGRYHGMQAREGTWWRLLAYPDRVFFAAEDGVGRSLARSVSSISIPRFSLACAPAFASRPSVRTLNPQLRRDMTCACSSPP